MLSVSAGHFRAGNEMAPSLNDESVAATRAPDDNAGVIAVGRLVEVASRTWPGINKPGGVGRVTRVYYGAQADRPLDDETPLTHIDVSYMVGRSREKRVPVEYVTLAPQYETTTTTAPSSVATPAAIDGSSSTLEQPRRNRGLRDRSLLLGRCRRCGSLRADCGSCDWVSEEQQEDDDQRHRSSNTRSTDTTALKSTGTLNRGNVLEDSSSESGSSDDDDVALHNLLRTSRKRYRRHLRNRRQWMDMWGEAGSKNQSQEEVEDGGKYPADDLLDFDREESSAMGPQTDDDNDDEDLEEMWQRSQWRYHHHVRQRAKWQRRIQAVSEEEPEPVDTTRRKSDQKWSHQHRSVLETLDANKTQDSAVAKSIGRKRKEREKKSKNPSRRVTMDKDTSLPQKSTQKDCASLAVAQTPPPPNSRQRPSDDQPLIMNVDKSPVGEAESSSPESLRENSGFSAFDNDDDDDFPMEDYARRVSTSTYHHNVDPMDGLDDSGPELEDDFDDTFIQPEGREAAENLPDDIVDRTKSIPFTQLPDVFETIATELEDHLVPDFRLKIAGLQRQHRRLVARGQFGSTENAKQASELLQQCHNLWVHVTRSLIQDGTDQCRAALRRLSDDRIFRKHRKHLSAKQRKQIRGSAMMDARNLRLDALEDTVEELVRTLKTVTAAFEGLSGEQDLNSGDDEDAGPIGQGNSSDDDEERGDEYATQDLIPLSRSSEMQGGETLDPAERPLGQFDPHQHAFRRRMSKQNSVHARRKEFHAQQKIGAAPAERMPKRPRASSFHSEDSFIVNDQDSFRRKSERDVRSSSSVVSHPKDQTSQDSEPSRFSPIAALTQVESDADSPMGEDEVESVAVFDFVNTEAEGAGGGGSQTTSTEPMVRPKRAAARQRRVTSSTLSDSLLDRQYTESLVQRDRVPISQRMQEFLDKNNHLSWDDGEHENDNKNPVNSRLNIREQRAARKSRSGLGQRRVVPDSSNRPIQGTITRLRRSADSATSTRDGTGEDIDDEECVSTEYLLSRFYSVGEIAATTTLPAVTVQDATERPQTWPNRQAHDPAGLPRAIRPLTEDGSESVQTTMEARQTPFDAFQLDGSVTLLEMVVCQSPRLGAQTQLLADMIRREDGFEISGGNRDDFRKLVVLQLLDAVFALTHPNAWALKIRNRIGALRLLEPIRDALAEVLPMTETLCTYMVENLSCQKWRKGSNGCVYVSSLDPVVWQQFVETGECWINQNDLRYKKLGKVWPRVEVETAWKVLLFFGAAKSFPATSSQFRWQFVTKLFSSSVLAKITDEEDSDLPPHPSHLAAFESDIDKLILLLRNGSLDELPPTDVLVTNLIKNAITLQAEDYLGNEESRFRSFPGLGRDKAASRFVSLLWKSTHSLFTVDGASVESEWFSIFDADFRTTRRPSAALELGNLLLPESRLVCGCLSLLVAWAQRVPKKKVRQLRLLKQLKGLRVSVSSLENDISKQPATRSSSDDFENAFKDKCPIEVGCAKDRMSTFLLEVSANLRIVDAILADSNATWGTKALNIQTLHELWDFVAFDALKGHRLALPNSSIGDFQNDSIDPLQVFIAGKIMATTAFLCMDRSPWYLTAASSPKRLSLAVAEHNGMIDYFAFPISCVCACVDYLGQEERNAPLLCRLVAMFTAIFNHLTVTIKIVGVNLPLNRVASQVGALYLPILMRCFRLHATRCEGTIGHTLLSLLLCAIRAVSTFQGTQRMHQISSLRASLPATNDESKAESDDFFDDLDDGVFASMATGESISAPSVADEQPHWKALVQILAMLKPSQRFKISTSMDQELTIRLTSHAEYILSKEIDKLCDCLVAIVGAQSPENMSDSLWKELVPLVRSSQCDTADVDFEMKVSRRLTSQLCLLSPHHDGCCAFVGTNIELFLCGILQALLDTNRLEIFPSCNFDLIRSLGGEGIAREILAELDVFNGLEPARLANMSIKELQSIADTQRRRKARAEAPWELLESLGDALSQQSQLSVAAVLKTIDNDLPSSYVESLHAACLEKECFSCFALIRNVVSAVSQRHRPMFESIVSQIVRIVSTEMLRILQGLRYFDQTDLGGSQDSATTSGRAKILSLFNSYSELFVATISWILREAPADAPLSWKLLQGQLCERVVYPLLRRQNVDLILSLKSVIAACQSTPGGFPVSVVHTSGIPGFSAHIEPLFDAAFRRCRQFVLAPIQSSVLQSYLVDGLLKVDGGNEASLAKLIGTAFTPSPVTALEFSQGPLQEEIDRYLHVVESGAPSDAWRHQMVQKRVETMRAVIIPKISQRKGSLDSKRKVIRVLSHILACSDGLQGLATENELFELLTSLVRSLRQVMFQGLKSHVVDDSLISVALACAANIALLEIPRKDIEDPRSLLCWSDEKVLHFDDLGDLSILCQDELMALYFHCYFHWMYSLGADIACGSQSTNPTLFDLRQLCCKDNTGDLDESVLLNLISARNDCDDSSELELWTKAFVCIEERLFGSKAENERPQVVNVYAKVVVENTDSVGTKDGVLAPWTPSRSVTRSAKEYMAVILSLSS